VLEVKRILLFRTDRLGDLILSLPVVEALRTWWPQARCDMLTDPRYVPAAGMQRQVGRVIPNSFRGLRGCRDLVRLLRSERYDATIHLYPRPLFAVAAFLAGIPVRLGTAYRFYSPLFKPRVPVHRKHMAVHERDLNLILLVGLGIPRLEVSAGLVVPEEASQQVTELLRREGIDGSAPFVVLHPGSGGSSLDWPATHYAALGRSLADLGAALVLTGTDRDRDAVELVHEGMHARTTNLCGRLDLPQLAALLARSALLITNSTGPLHLADALGTRVIGLYSPFFYSSPQRWGPYSQPKNILLPETVPATSPPFGSGSMPLSVRSTEGEKPSKVCYRCDRKRCPHFNCMASITPERVLSKAREILKI